MPCSSAPSNPSWAAPTWLLMLACCALLLPLQALAGTRLALVIGNSSYADRPLRNPGNDATDVATALKDLGFELYERKPQLNLNRRSFNATLGGFVRQASGADLVVIYYSGHGLQASGDNYLVPTDARIEEERDIRTEGIRLADLLNDLDDAKVQRTVVILDACRDNPFNSRAKSLKKGLARIEPQGATLIAFATAEGLTADDGTGRHGVYTEELLKTLRDRRLDVRDVLDETALAVSRASKGQRPRVYGDTAQFKGIYLGGGPGTQVASLDPVPVRPRPNGPTGGAANFGDLEQAQKEEAAAKQKWAAWQARMKADFNKAAGFNGSAELEAKAWERFLAAYAEDNPYSDEDDQLRAEAGRKQGAAQARVQARAQESARPAQATAAAGAVFKDCDVCPEMVVLPPGRFTMGSPDSEAERFKDEGPQHEVTINYKLAVGKYAVTFDEWRACVNGGGCTSKPNPSDQGRGQGRRPVIDVSWNDAQEYVQWLKGKTGKPYRLLSEAEWEYAARAGTATPFYTGRCINTSQANYNGNDDYNGCGAKTGTYLVQTQPVGSYAPNAFGLYDMAGNVWQWVGDVAHYNYSGAPSDGSVWTSGGDSSRRVLRGGSWLSGPANLRSAIRFRIDATNSVNSSGFRIARTY